MYDHIGLKVNDLAASCRFYQAALAPLGYVLGSHDESYAGIGPVDAPALWLYAAQGPRAQQVRTSRFGLLTTRLSMPSTRQA